jgi:hypothetical protein
MNTTEISTTLFNSLKIPAMDVQLISGKWTVNGNTFDRMTAAEKLTLNAYFQAQNDNLWNVN